VVDPPSDIREFTSGELLYFGLTFYLVCSPDRLELLDCPRRFRFWNNPWKWFAEASPYPMVAMVSRDHPGFLGIVRDAVGKQALIDAFRGSFAEL
jgi:hypothetical protein